MKSLILHIGTHKTGTTSIQRALHGAREYLSHKGFAYFLERDTAGAVVPEHHQFAKAAATGDMRYVAEALGRLRQETPRDATAIISSESMYRDLLGVVQWSVLDAKNPWDLRRRYLRHLRELFAEHHVSVVVFFRRADEFAEALYKTLIWGGHTRLHWKQYLVAAEFLHDYGRQLDMLREHFEDVRVGAYQRRGMIESFFSLIDCPLPPGDEFRENQSYDARLIAWMALRNHRSRPARAELTRQRAFCTTQMTRGLFAGNAASFWSSLDERIEFADPIEKAFPAGFFPDAEHQAVRPADLEPDERAMIDDLYQAWQREPS